MHVCVVTGEPAELHHIKTRGSGGTDDPWNLIPLSRKMHSMWHMKGMRYMVKTYPAIEKWVLANGWGFDDFLFKWFRKS